MLTTPDIVGLLTVLAALPAPFLVYYLRRDLSKPGVLWLSLFVCGAALWALSFGLLTVLNDRQMTLWLFHIDLFAVAVVTVSWFLFAVEFTHRVSMRWYRVLVPLLVPAFLIQILAWTNPSHTLLYTEATTVGPLGALRVETGPAFLFHTAVGMGLTLMAFGIFVGESLTSRGFRRRQCLLLLVTTVLVSSSSLLYAAGVTPAYFNPAPLTFLVVSFFLAVALLRYGMFRVNPVAHRTTFEEMADAVLMISEDGDVVDMNPTARALFDVDENTQGQIAAHSLFVGHRRLANSVLSGDPEDVEVTIPHEGKQRHYAVHSSPVEYGRGGTGWVLLMSDVTRLKEREQDLTILKQILSRVFRHNVRNELTTIVGRAELIGRNSGDVDEHVTKILERSFTLRTYSEKARMIERIIDEDEGRSRQNLADVVASSAQRLRSHYPDAAVETAVDESMAVVASRFLVDAVYNLMENGIVHGDDADPQLVVSGSAAEETVTLTISDNGPGIPQDEIDVLEAEAETALEHGSGIGLWLVNLVVDKSGGCLRIRTGADGTSVELELPRA